MPYNFHFDKCDKVRNDQIYTITIHNTQTSHINFMGKKQTQAHKKTHHMVFNPQLNQLNISGVTSPHICRLRSGLNRR